MGTLRASLVVVASLVAMVPMARCFDAWAAATLPPPQDVLHEVMPGDDLCLIAGYYYGDTRRWERIWQANWDQVRNPNRIERGMFLRIPDATVPEQPYAAFLARVRRPAAAPGAPAGGEAAGASAIELRAAEEPEAVYQKFHAAVLSGNLDQMLRYAPAARKAEVTAIPNREMIVKAMAAMMPKTYSITGKTVTPDGSRAQLRATGTIELFGKPDTIYGTINMLKEGGEWKVDESSWGSEKPAGEPMQMKPPASRR